jgi:hypothetical protein
LALAVSLLLSGRAPAGAAPLGPSACLPNVGYQIYNNGSTLLQGKVTLWGFPAVNIGTSGNVNWGIDPYRNVSWRRLFHTLQWLHPTIKEYMQSGDTAVRDRIIAIVRDWARDNPVSRTGDAWVGQITGLRASVLVCLSNAIGIPSWLYSTMKTHGVNLKDPNWYAGSFNQGIDQNIGLIGVACRLGNRSWADTAADRLASDIGKSIDAQGAPNEQAPGYSGMLYVRWNLASDKLKECGLPVPTLIASRVRLLTTFIAHATQPDGTYVQIGDTHAVKPWNVPDTPVEYVYTLGKRSSPPTERIRIYNAGFVFGRSSWTPFTDQTYYSLHFGPGRRYHGHQDHGTLTYMWRGRPVLVDSGHHNYNLGTYRAFLRSMEAHNTLAVSGAPIYQNATALTRSSVAATSQFYEMQDKTLYAGVTRTRGVLFVEDPGFAVVFDRATSSKSVTYRQYWHVPPGMKLAGGSSVGSLFRTGDGTEATRITNVLLPGERAPSVGARVVTGQTSPYQGWVSRNERDKTPNPTLSFTRSGNIARMLTVVAPSLAADAVKTYITTFEGGWLLSVRIGARVTDVFVSPGGSMRVRTAA